MKKKYKRALAAALAAVMIWNTCDWHPQVLAGSSVQYIEEVKELSDEILHQEVPYGTKYKDLELPDKLKVRVWQKKHRMKKTVQKIKTVRKRLLRRRSFKAETVKWKQKKSLRRFLHLKQMVQFGKRPHLRQMVQKNRK